MSSSIFFNISRQELFSIPYSSISVPELPKVIEKTNLDFQTSDTESTFYSEDWSTIIKDKYTGYFQDGLTITIGNNPTYDFQGITGIEKQFKSGDKITVYWRNISEEVIYFTPYLVYKFYELWPKV